MNIVVVLKLGLIRVILDKTNVGYVKSKDEFLKESDLTACTPHWENKNHS